MRRWRLITVPLLVLLPFGLAGLLGVRHTPSTLPACLDVVETVDFQRTPIDGLWVRQIEISNCGGTPISLDEVLIDGAGHADGFSVLGLSTPYVDVGAPLTLTIGFSPERLGDHAGALRIAARGNAPLEVGLSGIGTLPDDPAVDSGRCTRTLPGGFVARRACLDPPPTEAPSGGAARAPSRPPERSGSDTAPDMAPPAI